ncbi:MAG: dynamin family protein [Acidiferrobacterales bacterium]|nr:dynamin family protein [Acidiferrobacterales bacterium]
MTEAANTASLTAAADAFAERLDRYRRWREDLTSAITEYQQWAEQNNSSEGEDDLRIYELIDELKSDKLIVALAGEFSRGKTELLNALFFSDLERRLLPSSAGRTTMCPTELRWDEKDGACIKLLPIETRKTTLSISEYKSTPVHWTTLHILKPRDQDELSRVFDEVTKTKWIPIKEAQDLGLYQPELESEEVVTVKDGMVEIPIWRHAIINYPHPLLKQGLVILDTPGLNALGSEPELTYSTLPNAHAILFLLAADAGVTKTDMAVWKEHISRTDGNSGQERVVALNKIDLLWEAIDNDADYVATLNKQLDETARLLGVKKENIFPISAKLGLTGKIKSNAAAIKRSGIVPLEQKLADEIVPAKHEIIRRKVVYEISQRLQTSETLIKSRIASNQKQIETVKSLGGKNKDAIKKMVEHLRAEKTKYDKEIQGFNITRQALAKQAALLFSQLSIENLDRLIEITRRDMKESWTTRGLKIGMQSFFKGTTETMDNVKKIADEIKKSVDVIFAKLEKEYGMKGMSPPNLSLVPYVMEFRKLEARAEEFRNSASVVVTEQGFVIQKFFITMVSEARKIFSDCHGNARSWFQAVGAQVQGQILEHKRTIDQDMETLKKVHENMDNISSRMVELDNARHNLEDELSLITGLIKRIQQPVR